VLELVDGDGSASRFEYASWNLLHREIDPLGNATEYAYTKRERITKVVDPGGTTSEYAYDLRDNILRVTRNGNVREEYVRDEADNLTEKRDGSGRTILRFEIGPGNLKSVRRLASGENHYFEYDDSARMTRAATDAHETLFEYRFGRRPISDLRDGRGVRHEFERLGRAHIVTLNRFETRYARVRGGLIVTDPTGAKHRITARRDGKIVLELSNGTSETNRYDRNGRYLSKVRVGLESARRWVREYSYSNEGDLLFVEDTPFGNVRYEYDAAHRLVSESRSDGYRNEFRYDAAGNLLAKPALDRAVIAEGNRLLSANGTIYTYNDRDHIASSRDESRSVEFEYDSCDRLVRCLMPSGEWLSAYDPLGRRIQKSWKGSTTEYFWDHNRLAAELGENGSLRIYVYSDSSAIVPFMFVDYDSETAPTESGRRYFIASDQIGFPIQIENDRGEPVWRAKIDPYAVTHVQPGNKIDFALRFPGHQEDSEIGLFYNRFRHYSPALGRYLQSDPIGVAGGKNLYAYPASPLTNVDIFGLTHPPKTTGSEDPDEERVRPLTPEEEELAKKLVAATRARAQEILRSDNLRYGKGPVLTGVVDPRYPDDGPFFGQNTGVPPDICEPMRARLSQHISDLDNGRLPINQKAGDPGAHSEINALNQALVNRGEREGRPAEDSDINDMIGHNVSLKTNKVQNDDGTRTTIPAGEGNPPRCTYCDPLTGGMRMVDQNGQLTDED
jgi:RHS repeat-associated protein